MLTRGCWRKRWSMQFGRKTPSKPQASKNSACRNSLTLILVSKSNQSIQLHVNILIAAAIIYTLKNRSSSCLLAGVLMFAAGTPPATLSWTRPASSPTLPLTPTATYPSSTRPRQKFMLLKRNIMRPLQNCIEYVDLLFIWICLTVASGGIHHAKGQWVGSAACWYILG